MSNKAQKILFILLLIVAVGLTIYLVFGKKIKSFFSNMINKAGVINSDIPYQDASKYVADNNIPHGTSNGGKNYLPNAGGSDTPTAPTPNYQAANYKRILKKGSKGNEVLILQIKMNDYVALVGLQKIGTDGDFGSGTAKALKALTGRTSITLNDAIALIKKNSGAQSTASTPSVDFSQYGFRF